MTCHASIERIDDPRTVSFTSYMPKLHKRARSLIVDCCDAVLFLGEDLSILTDDRDRTRAVAAPARYLFCEGTPAYSAKNRFGWPAKIAVPKDFNFSQLIQPAKEG